MTSPTPANNAEDARWRDRRVLVAVAGGIASFKVCSLVSSLARQRAQVRVLMTDAATRFVAPMTFESLSGQPVVTSIWSADDFRTSQHVGLARWAELMIVAPATAHTLAKFAHGFADDPVALTATALPRTTPVLLAPAMNADMWANPVVQRNVQTVRDLLGWRFVGPDEGWQACRTLGQGRMSEPDAIVGAAVQLLPTQ